MASTYAGVKRPYSSTDESQAHKKRRVHSLRHVQHLPHHVEPAPQGGAAAPHTQDITHDQLSKSISAGLAIAGFDGVRPEALEMFKEHTEEYMLRFGRYVRTSMQGARRNQPTAQDFSMALSLMPNASTASLLKPQLSLRVPESISCPSISEPGPTYAPAPDLSELLDGLFARQIPSYIPKHFPSLPPMHTWQDTPVFTKRERDARKMREIMTQEGMMAEQALRKLATAAKAAAADALKAEKKKSNALSGPGKVRGGAMRQRERVDAFADVLRDVSGDATEDLVMEGVDALVDGDVDVGMPEGVVVNYDMNHWRHGRKAMRL